LPAAKTNLSAQDLAFGEQQVARMVADRPQMALYVSKSDPLWEFCVRAFAGGFIGERIYWQNDPPESDALADHISPYPGQQPAIRIRRTYPSAPYPAVPFSCEDLWGFAVFELENLRNSPAFLAMGERASEGEASREQYIRELTRLEYYALLRTAQDYGRLWIPIALRRGLLTPHGGRAWGVGAPNTYETWISQYRDPASYPWDCYGRYYDRFLAARAQAKKNLKGPVRYGLSTTGDSIIIIPNDTPH